MGDETHLPSALDRLARPLVAEAIWILRIVTKVLDDLAEGEGHDLVHSHTAIVEVEVADWIRSHGMAAGLVHWVELESVWEDRVGHSVEGAQGKGELPSAVGSEGCSERRGRR